MVGHHCHVRRAFQNLGSEHGQGPLGADLKEHASTSTVHGSNLFGPFHRGRHLRCKFLQDARFCILPFGWVKGTVNVGRDGDAWPSNLEPFEETAQGFVRWRHDSGMESMRCGQRHTIESLRFEGRHRRFDRCGFACDDGHLGRILVGGDHVTFGCVEYLLHLVVGCRDARHEALVIDFDRPHFGAASGSGAQGTVHVQNA